MALNTLPQIVDRERINELSGRAILQGAACVCGDAIKPGDLVAVNFDVKRVHTGGGLYLFEAVQDGRVTWHGCRSMIRVPDGITVDQNGYGDRVTLPNLDTIGWRVVGTVETVYKAIRYQ